MKLLDVSVSKSTLASIASKISTIASVIYLVSIAKESLPIDDFALWLVYLTLMQIMQFSDFGLGNGVVSILTQAGARYKKNEYDIYSSEVLGNTFLLLAYVAFTLSIATLAISFLLDWQDIFQIYSRSNSELSYIFLFFILIILATVPFTIVQKNLWVQHKMYVTHYMQIIIVLIQVCIFYVLSLSNVGVSYYILSIPASSLTVYFIFFYSEFLKKNSGSGLIFNKKNKDMLVNIFSSGLGWFSTQLVLYISIGLDLIYVNYFFDKQQSLEFGILLKLMQGLSISLFFTMPLWPKISEIISEHGVKKAVKVFYSVLIISTIVGLLSGLFLFIFADDIVFLWIGVDLIHGKSMIIIFSIWTVVFNIWCAVAAFIGNKKLMKIYISACFIGGILSVLFKYPLLISYGSSGVLASSVLGILVSILYSLYSVLKMAKE